MKRLVLTSVSAIALGLVGAGMAQAQNYNYQATGNGSYNATAGYGATAGYNGTSQSTQSQSAQYGATAGYGATGGYDRADYNSAAGYGATPDVSGPGAFALLLPRQVAQAQAELARAGLYTGAVTGRLDAATSEALADWQAQHGLAATGGFDPTTMASLGLSTAPPYYYEPAGTATAYGYGASAPAGYTGEQSGYGYGASAPAGYTGEQSGTGYSYGGYPPYR